MIVISATIDYNGSTIATVTNETKILTTGGKWVTGNIKITDVNEAPNVTQDQEGYVVLDDGGTPQTIVNPLSIASNGTYSASSGYAFNPVTVSISGVGGISIDDIAMKTISGSISGDATTISDYAFYHCPAINTVSFSSCEYIGLYAFGYCSELTTVNFPLCTHMSSNTFSNCINLTTISFPICTIVGTNDFYNCTKLTAASFPMCTMISQGAFFSCYSLSEIYSPLCSFIGERAFYHCSELTAANFSICSRIDNSAFYSCIKLKTINFPSCKYIGSYAFDNCSELITANFPLCSSIGSYAFAYCNKLSSIRFTSCENIAAYAFQGCNLLTTVIFSNSSTIQGLISVYAFRSCYNLLSLYLLASMLYRLSGSSIFISTPISDYTTSTGGVYGSIYVPQSLYNSYISSTNWSYYSSRFVSLTESQVSYVLEHGTHIIS